MGLPSGLEGQPGSSEGLPLDDGFAGDGTGEEAERVSHFHSPADLARLGRQCERIALAKGIRYHVNDRTLIDGHRAIVFPD